jgi:hypothetical protein
LPLSLVTFSLLANIKDASDIELNINWVEYRLDDVLDSEYEIFSLNNRSKSTGITVLFTLFSGTHSP